MFNFEILKKEGFYQKFCFPFKKHVKKHQNFNRKQNINSLHFNLSKE